MFTELPRIQERATARDEDAAACERHEPHPYRIVTCEPDHPARHEAETFVRDAFFRTHRASIRTFMPTLLTLVDASGSLHAVAGARLAANEKLFLERYLPRPIDALLAARGGVPPARAQIVEIGNFACRGSRIARRFLALLPFYLLDRKLTWVTFTATAAVRRLLHNIGARCMELGVADGACARDGADDWGRYYTHDPRVMAGYLPLARRIPALLDAAYGN
ncbi:MAG TPA: thermostable hemolysin [Steroidobacteraceae bacterium]|nr:thermostable hemolysin [Steroidobacteraceae bacterium]